MGRKIERVKPGDPITSDLWNAIADRLEPWTKFNIVQGSYLNLTAGPNGKLLGLRVPREIPVRLSGSSSPYSWTALAVDAAGAYVDRTAGLTGGSGNAYEINGKSGLGGKVVMLHWTAAGDYRFKWVGTIQSTLTLRINGCSSNQSKGVTVNVYDASSTLIFSYYDSQTGNTTNMPFPSASGTGTIEIISDFPDRFSPVTAPITYSPGANNAGTFTFGVNTGYHCVAASGSLRYPCPDVLHWSDTTWGSITLNHGAGAGHSPLGPWWGQKSVVIGGTPTLINYNFGRLTFTSEYNIVVQRDTGGSVIGQWNLAFSSTSIAPASATGVDGGFNPGSTGTLNE